MNPKYELSNKTMRRNGRILYRIRALRDFGSVKAGDLGGWIESEDNLSHYGNCWVFDDGQAFDNGYVSNNGIVYDGVVSGHGMVCDNGRLYDGVVSGHGMVYNNATVYSNGMVCKMEDIFTLSNVGSRGGDTTFFRCDDGEVKVNCGCFFGTLSEFAEAVKKTHGNNKFAKEYALVIELAKVHMEVDDELGILDNQRTRP